MHMQITNSNALKIIYYIIDNWNMELMSEQTNIDKLINLIILMTDAFKYNIYLIIQI